MKYSSFAIHPFSGYEVIGLEHLPEGPALLIYYHGVLTVDYACFVAMLYREKRRHCYSVSDHLVFRIPGKVLIICFEDSKSENICMVKYHQYLRHTFTRAVLLKLVGCNSPDHVKGAGDL